MSGLPLAARLRLLLQDGGRGISPLPPTERKLCHARKCTTYLIEAAGESGGALARPRWGSDQSHRFVLAYTVAGILRPGYSPIHQPISDLGVGSNGSLMDTIAVVHALLLMAFAVGFAL